MRENVFSLSARHAHGPDTEESVSQYSPVAAAMIQKLIL